MSGNTILVAGNSNDALPFILTTNKESLSLYLLDKLYSLCGDYVLSDNSYYNCVHRQMILCKSVRCEVDVRDALTCCKHSPTFQIISPVLPASQVTVSAM